MSHGRNRTKTSLLIPSRALPARYAFWRAIAQVLWLLSSKKVTKMLNAQSGIFSRIAPVSSTTQTLYTPSPSKSTTAVANA